MDFIILYFYLTSYGGGRLDLIVSRARRFPQQYVIAYIFLNAEQLKLVLAELGLFSKNTLNK